MLDQIERLLVLQDRDQRLAAISQQRKAIPIEKARVERQKGEAQRKLEGVRTRLRENEVTRKTLEIDAQTRRDAIAKYKQQQLATRKNEEFTALAHEIERAEIDIQKIEDREIELMENAELLKAELASAEMELASATKELTERVAAIESRAAILENQEREISAERATLASAIDSDFVEIYARIFKKKGDAALAPLEHGVCGGCHMKVSTSTASEVKNGNTIVTCDQCGRILYAAEA
jgi:predicted  nucleic acid-binding Zn-ribbon protein